MCGSELKCVDHKSIHNSKISDPNLDYDEQVECKLKVQEYRKLRVSQDRNQVGIWIYITAVLVDVRSGGESEAITDSICRY